MKPRNFSYSPPKHIIEPWTRLNESPPAMPPSRSSHDCEESMEFDEDVKERALERRLARQFPPQLTRVFVVVSAHQHWQTDTGTVLRYKNRPKWWCLLFSPHYWQYYWCTHRFSIVYSGCDGNKRSSVTTFDADLTTREPEFLQHLFRKNVRIHLFYISVVRHLYYVA